MAGAALTAAQWGTAVELLDRIPGADPAALAARADALFGAGDPVGAQRAALGALDAGNDDPAAQGQAWAVLGQCLAVNDPAGSVVAWRQAATLAARNGLSTLRVRAAIALALTAAEQDEPWQQLKVVRDLAIDAGLLASAAAVDLLTGDVLSTVEGPAAGLGYARQAASLSADLRLPALEATAQALVAALSAERDETPTGTTATWLAADAPDEIVALSALATAMTYLHRDDVGAMYELLDEGTARMASPTAAPLKYWGIWAVLAAAHGRWDGPAQQRFAASSAAMNPLNVAGRLLADAVLAGREQGPDAAGLLYREALDLIPQRRWWAAVLAHLVQPSAVADGSGDADRRAPAAGRRVRPIRRPRPGTDLPIPATCPGRGGTPTRPGRVAGIARVGGTRRHQPRTGRARADPGRPHERRDRRPALPLDTHGGDTRRPSAHQDRRRRTGPAAGGDRPADLGARRSSAPRGRIEPKRTRALQQVNPALTRPNRDIVRPGCALRLTRVITSRYRYGRSSREWSSPFITQRCDSAARGTADPLPAAASHWTHPVTDRKVKAAAGSRSRASATTLFAPRLGPMAEG